MDYWQRERLGFTSGIGAVVLFVAAAALITSYPTADASPETIRAFILDNRTTIVVQSFIFGFAVLAGLWFIASLHSALRRAEGGTGRVSNVALFGVGGALVGMLASGGLTVVAANRVAETVDPGVTFALWQAGNVAFSLSGFLLALGIGAATLVSIRTNLLPAWLTSLSVAFAALCLVGPVSTFFEGGTMGLGGGVPFGLESLGVFGWVLGTSITMIVKLRAPMDGIVARRRITDVTQEPPRAVGN